MASASLRISSSNDRIVTLAVLMALGILLPTALRAEDAPLEISTTGEVDIEAKAYDLKTVRPSKSGRVYLFEKPENDLPVDGKLFLVRSGETPVMAMRVLKTYPVKNRIAAKKLRTYPGFEILEPGSTFRAFEKVGEKVLPVPPTEEDLKDLTELESSEFGVPTEEPIVSPPPVQEESPELRDSSIEDQDSENDYYYPNWFTMAIGNVPNNTVPGPNTKFSGGLLYSRNFEPTLAGEVGFFYYRSSGDVDDSNVTMTVVPFVATLRLQKRYGELWTGYAYGGFMYPFISSQIGATNTLLRKIQVISPALGVGAFLKTGPNWYLRLNLGLDSMTVGVMLRF